MQCTSSGGDAEVVVTTGYEVSKCDYHVWNMLFLFRKSIKNINEFCYGRRMWSMGRPAHTYFDV